MVTPILLKRSTTSGNVPSSLAAGELALNLADELAFFRNPGGVVTPLKLADCECFIARGVVTNAASVVLSIDPAVIGIMRAFVLHLTDFRGSSSGNNIAFRFGDSTGIKSGGSNYEWGQFYCSAGNGGFFSSGYDRSDSAIALTQTNDSTTSHGQCGTVWFGTNDPAATVENWTLANFGSAYNISGYYNIHTFSVGAYNGQLDLTQISLQYYSGNIATGKYELIGIL